MSVVILSLLSCTGPATDSAGKTTDSAEDSEPTPDSSPPEETTVLQSCGRSDVPTSLPAPQTQPESGQRYRIVGLPGTSRAVVYAIVFYPGQDDHSLYDEGLPVIVSFGPTVADVQDADPLLPEDPGIVELQAIYPGITTEGYTTEGPKDYGGPDSAAAGWDVIRFATGEITTTDGYTLRELVGLSLCDAKALVLSSSGGGTIAMEALRAHVDELDDKLIGFASHESPSTGQLMAQDGGAIWMDPNANIDGDGNGFFWDDGRNPTFDLGLCSVEDATCALDYSTIRWDSTTNLADAYPDRYRDGDWEDGVLYLDRTENGALDLIRNGLDLDGDSLLDEDFAFLPIDSPYGSDSALPRLWFTAEATAALAALGGEWPADVATVEQVTPFWADRNMTAHILEIAPSLPADFAVSVDYTEMDHAIGIGTRPHIWMVYEAFRRAGASVRYNASADAMACIYDASMLTDWAGELAPGAEIAEADVSAWAMPEVINNEQARAASSLGILWDKLGPFDQCPQYQ